MKNCEHEVKPDEFDRANGITAEEIIANIWEAHWAGRCDPMTCPICNEEERGREEERGKSGGVVSCRSCDEGWPIFVLDEDGVLSAVSGKAGEVCHAVDDTWSPCTAWPQWLELLRCWNAARCSAG